MPLRPTRRTTGTTLALLTSLVLAGCSGGSSTDGPTRITLTPRAVAAITHDVLGERVQDSFPVQVSDGVGAELALTGISGYQGDRLRVTVRPTLEGEQSEDLCAEVAETVTGCDQLSNDKSIRLWLTWTTEEPGGDPGRALLTRMRGGETSTVEVTGPVITGDPRVVLAGDRITVPIMRKVLEDPRLDLVTSEAALLLADQLTAWHDSAPGATAPAAS